VTLLLWYLWLSLVKINKYPYQTKKIFLSIFIISINYSCKPNIINHMQKQAKRSDYVRGEKK